MARFPALPCHGIEATFAVPAKIRVIAMASRITDRLRNEVLNLPDAERAALARELVQSLDGPADADAAKEWEAEILRRLDAVDSGRAQIIDRAEFSKRMRDRLHRL
jgi:putative addiction module component (TIGR02574 family)